VLDYSGSYTPAWATSAALMTIGAVVLAMTPPPGHPHDRTAGPRTDLKAADSAA
jgi:hypothetical protein